MDAVALDYRTRVLTHVAEAHRIAKRRWGVATIPIDYFVVDEMHIGAEGGIGQFSARDVWAMQEWSTSFSSTTGPDLDCSSG